MEKKNKVENYVEYRFIHKDGSIKWFADLFVVLFDMNYRPLYVVGSIRDITRQKEDEENLLKMQRQIAQNQKMEALGRFSNEIVHDFNNIISGLVGNIELSKDNMTKIKNSISFFDTKIEKFKNHHEILEQINIISNNINEIEDILNDQFLIVKKSQEIVEKIKLFSKPKSQESEIVEINSAISELKPLFDYSNNKKIRIEYELSNKKIFIRINRSQFEQIILNLIVNSFDAIDKKEGRILIKTELIKNTNIFALDKNIGKIFAKISIIDNGCGIDEKIISNIFEPYFTTKGKKGTGLGLSIVYSIIKKNNGFIDVNSKLNEGTEFIIHFPLCKEGKTKNENKFSQNF